MKLLPPRNLRLVMTETLKKTDDDHDSGTESDDESAEIEELQKYMEQSIQLEDGSGGHSPSRRRAAAVLCQHTRFRQQQQQQQLTESQQTNNKPVERRRQQQQQHQHNQHKNQQQQQQRSELLSGPAVVSALLSATTAGAAPQCCGPCVGGSGAMGCSGGGGGSPALLDSALPSDSDPNLEQHSSEEELEVINNRAGSAEKRKWSQANQRRTRGARASLRRSRSDGAGDDTSSDEEEYDAGGASLADGAPRSLANGCRSGDEDEDDDDDEDDEEVRDLTWSGRGGEVVMNGVHGGGGGGGSATSSSSARSSSQRSSSSSTVVVPPTPVEFRASPPLHVHRPYNGSPPPKVFHAAPSVIGSSSSSSAATLTLSASAHIPAFEVCAVSPRKRHRQDRGGGGTAFGVFSLVDGGPVQRPCLDFEKMQQIRVKLL